MGIVKRYLTHEHYNMQPSEIAVAGSDIDCYIEWLRSRLNRNIRRKDLVRSGYLLIEFESFCSSHNWETKAIIKNLERFYRYINRDFKGGLI